MKKTTSFVVVAANHMCLSDDRTNNPVVRSQLLEPLKHGFDQTCLVRQCLSNILMNVIHFYISEGVLLQQENIHCMDLVGINID